MAKNQKYPTYKYLLAALDWFTVSTALLMAFNLREHWLSTSLLFIDPSFYAEVAFFVGYGAGSVFIFQYFNLYKINVFITLVEHTIQFLKAMFFAVIGIALVSFFTKASWVVDSRLAIIYFMLIATLGGILLRVICFRKLFMWLSKSNILRRNVLIVGANESGKNLAVNLAVHGYGGLNLVGFVDDDVPLGKVVFGGAKIIGRVSEVHDIVSVFGVDEIFICLDDIDHTRMMEVVEAATKTRANVKISSPLYDVIPSRIFMEQYGKVPVVTVSQTQPSQVRERYKRVFDIVLVVIGSLLLSPFFLVIALLIKLDSPGSVLFKQVRIGKNGRPFMFYKFRSMLVGSDNDETRKHNATQFVKGTYDIADNGNGSTKIVNESRVTRVGKWLRRTSLDELPQLLNVLKGEMSLVGPRPCLPYEWEHYQEWHKKRLSVTPGCTGMWQVSGRSIVEFEDMVILDLYYIQNSSLLMDLRLLVKTVPTIFLGTGAR
ncbi:MAG: exopolysaccharide biosynthesis polyprenyl glycosylphosphotransferase [Bacteroidetes bacterium]|nr:exopolysaccharide biosynthesis polyprenyl glycosylphosphotransferase [Bacteroidota bacterium]